MSPRHQRLDGSSYLTLDLSSNETQPLTAYNLRCMLAIPVWSHRRTFFYMYNDLKSPSKSIYQLAWRISSAI